MLFSRDVNDKHNTIRVSSVVHYWNGTLGDMGSNAAEVNFLFLTAAILFFLHYTKNY
jgi:hypothetical protein